MNNKIIFKKEKYQLLPLQEEHIKILYDWNIAEKHFEQFTCRPIKLCSSFDEYKHKILKRISEGNERIYVLVDKEDSTIPLGKITLFDFNPRNHSAEFGYYFPDINRAKGLGIILLYYFLKKVFCDKALNLNKLYATTSSNNIPSIKLLEKFNFSLDGRMREHYWIDENKYDQLVYSLLKNEWKVVERKEWLIEKRRKAEERYDTIFSLDYDEKWGYIEEEHKRMILKFVSHLGENPYILDAACGTGKYWSILKEYNLLIKGIDQSHEMLKKAKVKNEKYETEKKGLQEINEIDTYDGIMCIDAMENVFPEDWKDVLENFYNALKKEGKLYFTVETVGKEELDEAFSAGKKLGLPIVYGEVAHQGGYHYYPEIVYVQQLLKDAGFKVIEESISDGYHHFLSEKR